MQQKSISHNFHRNIITRPVLLIDKRCATKRRQRITREQQNIYFLILVNLLRTLCFESLFRLPFCRLNFTRSFGGS